MHGEVKDNLITAKMSRPSEMYAGSLGSADDYKPTFPTATRRAAFALFVAIRLLPLTSDAENSVVVCQ